MLRRAFNLANKNTQSSTYKLSLRSKFSSEPPTYIPAFNEEEHKEARAWLASFLVKDIPKKSCEINFTRASGPGGQNVNKVHTKANLRIKIQDLLPLLPSVVRPAIMSSRYYTKNSHSLMISADGSRSQATNLQECYTKLHDAIVTAAKRTVKEETAPEKIQKLKNLVKKSNENRLRAKKTLKGKKAGRRGSSE